MRKAHCSPPYYQSHNTPTYFAPLDFPLFSRFAGWTPLRESLRRGSTTILQDTLDFRPCKLAITIRDLRCAAQFKVFVASYSLFTIAIVVISRGVRVVILPTGTLPDPYLVLVSEAMLQQTQVATVVPFFQRFLARFPTLSALAEAGEQDVLRLWQGLGYYSRARNLHRAAKTIGRDFDGHIPKDCAIVCARSRVSVATPPARSPRSPSTRREPIVDGNVARVLCRIDWVKSDPREPKRRRVACGNVP